MKKQIKNIFFKNTFVHPLFAKYPFTLLLKFSILVTPIHDYKICKGRTYGNDIEHKLMWFFMVHSTSLQFPSHMYGANFTWYREYMKNLYPSLLSTWKRCRWVVTLYYHIFQSITISSHTLIPNIVFTSFDIGGNEGQWSMKIKLSFTSKR